MDTVLYLNCSRLSSATVRRPPSLLSSTSLARPGLNISVDYPSFTRFHKKRLISWFWIMLILPGLSTTSPRDLQSPTSLSSPVPLPPIPPRTRLLPCPGSLHGNAGGRDLLRRRPSAHLELLELEAPLTERTVPTH